MELVRRARLGEAGCGAEVLSAEWDGGARLVVAGSAGALVWDVATSQAAAEWRPPAGLEGESTNHAVFLGGEALGGEVCAVACGPVVHLWDLRAGAPAHAFAPCGDEVNQLAVDPATGCTHLAAADDAGEVVVYDVAGRRHHQTLRGPPGTICTTVQFRPSKPNLLFCGGLDSRLVLWNVERRKALRKIDTGALLAGMLPEGTASEDSPSLGAGVNPALVHSLAVSSDDAAVACALGSAAVAVIGLPKRSAPACEFWLSGGHTASVSQVRWVDEPTPCASPGQSRRLLVSGGNDARLCLWDLGAGGADGADGAVPGLAPTPGAPHPALAAVVEHKSKVNWLALQPTDAGGGGGGGGGDGQHQRPLLAVVDQTRCVSLYELGGLSSA